MKRIQKYIGYFAVALIGLVFSECKKQHSVSIASSQYQYIVFPLSEDLFNNGLPASNPEEYLTNALKTLVNRVGTAGTGTRHLAFMISIPTWDTASFPSAEQLVAAAVKAAVSTDAAIYFFVPSATGWEARPDLWNYNNPDSPGYNPANKYNVEWYDWSGSVYPHEYRDWGTPEQLPPPMCYNAASIKSELSAIISGKVAPLIMQVIDQLTQAGKSYLFAGITMGDEQVLYNYSFVDSVDPALGKFMSQQSAAKIPIGFNALINKGYSASHPPADFAGALAQVNHDLVSYCCMLLHNAGIPSTSIYTHIAAAAGYAGTPGLQFSNAPLSTAFNDYSTPGFTTYITGDPNDLSLIYSELAAQKSAHWASTEANPYFGGSVSPDGYIRMHFDHGATVMVLNIGATSVALSNNLYQGVYGPEAIRAYYSFLTNY